MKKKEGTNSLEKRKENTWERWRERRCKKERGFSNKRVSEKVNDGTRREMKWKRKKEKEFFLMETEIMKEKMRKEKKVKYKYV